MQSFDRTIHTRSKEKVELFSKILTGALMLPDSRTQAEDFMNVLSELSDTEIKIAKLVFELKQVDIRPIKIRSLRLSRNVVLSTKRISNSIRIVLRRQVLSLKMLEILLITMGGSTTLPQLSKS